MRTPGIVLVVVFLTNCGVCQAQVDQLLRYCPSDANSVLAIDVAAALQSPLARQEGWGKRLETEFVNRTIMLPPEAQRVLVASTLRPDRGFESDSTVAIFELSKDVPLPMIARANRGRLEKIRDIEVIAGMGDLLVAPLDPKVLGVFVPDNRQMASRWLREAASSAPRVSTFLASAVKQVTKDRPIVLAIDLEDMVSEDDAAVKLKASGILKGTPYEAPEVAALLRSARGLVLEISVSTEARARARIEFGQPVKPTAALMKQIILHGLNENGLNLDELESLQFNVTGKLVEAETKLSAGGLKRLMSLLDVPTPEIPIATSESTSASTPAENSTARVAAKSQAYFRSVVSLLDDLHGDRSKQDPRGGQDAVWMEKYAQKIDRLPVLDVDPEIVDWGTKTAQTLRVMSTSRRDAGLTAGSQKSGLRTGVYFNSYYGGYGGSSATATAKDANQIDVQTGNVATANRVEGWRLIDNATADIRKKATVRYGVEF